MRQWEPSVIRCHRWRQGIVLTEPSLVVTGADGKTVVAAGGAARSFPGAHSPLQNGQVANYDEAVELFRHCLEQVWGRQPLRKPRVAVCMQAKGTQVEETAMSRAWLAAGARRVTVTVLTPRQAGRAFQPNDWDLIFSLEKPAQQSAGE